MRFAVGALCKLATPGTLVFSNEVSAAGALAVGEDDADAELSYDGELLPASGYVTLFPGKRLADYDVKSSYLKHKNGYTGGDLLIGPEGLATPECVERGTTADGADKVRVLMQKWKEPNVISIELELVQQGDDIVGRTPSVRYSSVNLLGLDLQKLFADKAKLCNNTSLVNDQAIVNLANGTKGYGINQLTMMRRNPARKVVFAGPVSLTGEAVGIAKGTHLEFADQNTAVGKISGGGTLAFSSERNARQVYSNFIPASGGEFILVKNRLVSELASMSGTMYLKKQSTGTYLDGKGVKFTVSASGIAKAYEIERIQNDSKGRYRCQFQILGEGKTPNEKKVFICVIRFYFWQDGADIKARSYNEYASFKLLGEGNAPGVGLGNDFDTGNIGEGCTIRATASEWSASLKDIVVDFKSFETSIVNTNSMPDQSVMLIKGPEGGYSANIIKVKDSNAVCDGNVIVEANGVLDLDIDGMVQNGPGVNYSKSVFYVMTNGILRASKGNVLSTYAQKICLYGGEVKFGYGLSATKDHSLGAGDLVLADGALLSGSSPRVGFQMTNPIWRVTGNLPSACDSGAFLMKKPNVPEPTIFRLYVDDVTKDAEADFIVNGALKMYQASQVYDDITLRKLGDGTVLQNGYSEVKLPTEIWRGGWTFGKSGVSHGSQEFILEGGTALSLASGVSNGLAKVTVKAPATLVLAEGSLLTLDDLEASSGKTLQIEGEFGKGIKSVRVAKMLPRSVLAYVRCEEGRVSQNDEGYLQPMPKVFYMTVR